MSNRTVLVRRDERECREASPGEFLQIMLGSEDTKGLLSWKVITVDYLSGPPYHIHLEQDEVVAVIEGEVKVKLDGELFDMGAGDLVFIPKGVPHTFCNLGQDQRVRLIAMHTPGGFDEFMREIMALPSGMWDPAVIGELSARYAQQLAGAPLAVELGLLEPYM